MTKPCIYFVGKPYPHFRAHELIKKLGFGVGILHDKNVPLNKPENYDDIIEVDFSSNQSVIDSLPAHSSSIKGLVCTYENYIIAKALLGDYLGLPSITMESAEISTDKYLMRQAFMKANTSISPNFGLANDLSEVRALSQKLRYPLILKPTNLVKSLLVLRCNNETELFSNFEFAKQQLEGLYNKHRIYNRKPQLIVEEYIIGKTCSVAAFVDQKGIPHFCEGIVSLINAQDLGVDDNFIYGRILPANFDDQLTARLFDVSRQGIAALQMTSSPAHIELIYNDHQVKLIEIGARIGGYRPRMYEMSYNIDLIEQELKLALGQTPILDGEPAAFSAVFELFPRQEGLFQSIEGKVDTAAFRYFSVKAGLGDKVGPAKRGYKAAAVIIVSSPDEVEFKELCDRVNQLKVRVN